MELPIVELPIVELPIVELPIVELPIVAVPTLELPIVDTTTTLPPRQSGLLGTEVQATPSQTEQHKLPGSQQQEDHRRHPRRADRPLQPAGGRLANGEGERDGGSVEPGLRRCVDPASIPPPFHSARSAVR